MSTNRSGLTGRGLGGIGGSIISSSGINQNFKDYSNGAAKGQAGANNGVATNKEERELISEEQTNNFKF